MGELGDKEKIGVSTTGVRSYYTANLISSFVVNLKWLGEWENEVY